MTAPQHDVELVGGRVFDSASGSFTDAALALRDGRIAGVGEPIGARRQIDVSGLIVVPGLIDLHVHVFPGVSHYGIGADEHCLLRGVTTAVDAGSAGAQTFPGFRAAVIERQRTRVLAYLHIAVAGMISPLVGELEDIRWASPALAVARAREHADVVVGIKVRLGWQMVGRDPEPALRQARKAADRLGLPLMVHIIDMPRSITWLLPLLGPGDVVTHCFHGNAGGILDERGRVHRDVFAARSRGVVFDVGHGVGSFTFRVARAAVEQGFAPDVVSSDIHAYNVGGPVYDHATTLSKLLHLGMPLPDLVGSATAAPAATIDRSAVLGSLAVGREADVTVLEVARGARTLVDGEEARETASEWLVPRLVVRAGTVLELGRAEE